MPVLDYDTFVIAVYTWVDDLLGEELWRRTRRGRPPVVSNVDIVTIMLLQQWWGLSERRMLWCVRRYLPMLGVLSQSAYHRRTRRLAWVWPVLAQRLAQELGASQAPYELADGTPVPLAKRCRGEHGRCFGTAAGITRGGSDRSWYYGMQLMLATTRRGVITGWVIAPAGTNERWVLDTLLLWRRTPDASPRTPDDLAYRKPSRRLKGPTGPIVGTTSAGAPSRGPYLVDNAFYGDEWTIHWRDDLGADVRMAHSEVDDAATIHTHHRRRQRIETVIGVLDTQLHLKQISAKTPEGAVAQINAKCAAFNLGYMINRQFHRPPLAIGSLPWT